MTRIGSAAYTWPAPLHRTATMYPCRQLHLILTRDYRFNTAPHEIRDELGWRLCKFWYPSALFEAQPMHSKPRLATPVKHLV